MNPANFELQHSDVDQPKLLDGECATREWPMPEGGKWEPVARTGWPAGLLQDDCRALSQWFSGRLNAVRRLRK